MRTVVYFSFLMFCITRISVMAQEQQVVVPYTLADRDRAILTDGRISNIDTGISALETKMDLKFEGVEKQFLYQQRQLDDIKTLFYWGFGILISLFVFMLGYMIWDRRTALQPALEKSFRS